LIGYIEKEPYHACLKKAHFFLVGCCAYGLLALNVVIVVFVSVVVVFIVVVVVSIKSGSWSDMMLEVDPRAFGQRLWHHRGSEGWRWVREVGSIGVQRGVSKKAAGHPPCGRATPETVVRGGPPAGRRRIRNDGHGQNYMESIATSCHPPLMGRVQVAEVVAEVEVGITG
jgi:hypothetical protein